MAAGSGLLTAGFLQAAVAAADTGADPSATGADAFTIGGYTFDPFTVAPVNGVPGAQDHLPPSGVETEGFTPVIPLSTAPPLLTLGGASIGGGALDTAPQYFEVYSPSGTDLGSIDAGETVTNLAGFTNTEFHVSAGFPAGDGSALPTVGSVYDVFNLGNGYANVYTATPDVGSAKGTVTDTFVTPYGSTNLDSLFGGINAANPLQPGDAFTGLEIGDSSVGKDAFSIGGYTLDPTLAAGGEGFDPVGSIVGAPPLLNIGGAALSDPLEGGNLVTQGFTVLGGTGSNLGTITTGEEVTNLLGMTNTQLIVTGGTAADGGSAADLPATGTVLDAFNLGGGWENVYTATPDVTAADGTVTSGTVTDTLVTPFGSMNLDSLFGSVNAANPLQPGDAFTGLEAVTAAGGSQAFAIDGTTFDPTLAAGGEGYDTVYQVIGAPPLLNLGGGVLSLGSFLNLPLAPQDFNLYDGTGASATEIGSVTTSENVTNLLGFTNTEFTIDTVTAATGQSASDLPAVGSVYDVFNLGGGIENIYTAIPGVDGAASTIIDTLVTPWGNFDLDSMFGGIDAAMPLDPGDAFLGL
ncbi:MAG: hypothetical protein ABI253_10900 [Mycobacterium sp.]